MKNSTVHILRKIFGTEELSEKDVKCRIVRSCMGITMAVCVIYGSYSIPAGVQRASEDTDADAPRLVILGREEEETIAVIAETIHQEDGKILSLNDFLDTLICGACSRKCPLLAPRCRRGMAKAETQTEYYHEAVAMIEADA